MTAPDSVYDLVAKFERQKPANETELRRQFVDPFFGALGWDVTDSEQVGHEVSVLVHEAGAQKPKRPDYGFRVDGATHFFVETKPPHLNLKDDSTPAFQLRRYGWSGNKPVSILTDFEEFAVYDCRVKPQRSDPASKARLRYYRYGEYIENWNDIAERFSRQAVIDGALQRWIGGTVTRGVVGVDEAFLREMEGWRENLARDIALHNSHLNRRDLNLLVQRAIDRIVFLRIAEDRGIESYGRLRSAVAPGRQAYSEIKRLFHEADDKYNSGLFDFRADALSLQIHISDEALRGIISQLYYPESPYEFSAIPADILGQVYERFLGKVIQLSSAGGVRIEEKPEVRKAGGVYYTPTTIVDYIVRNTVGALLDGATPEAAAELRVLDPACGSGSFLNGAYQYLLDWHLDAYRENPQRYRNRVRHTPDGMILTTAEKRRILLNNIYGVDLDQSAVEVTKLSLLLKMLENEKGGAGVQTLMFSAGGRILPDLGGNIKWGNSLIGSDFYQGKQIGMFDEEALYRVKAFDWDSGDGFGDAMKAGGFDAVIGNPPYGSWFDASQQKYLTDKFGVFRGIKDIYVAFMERAITLARQDGLVSFIVPSAWAGGPRYRRLRDYLLPFPFKSVVMLPYDVFADAYVDTLVFVLNRSQRAPDHVVSTYVYGKRDKLDNISLEEDQWDRVEQTAWQETDNHKFVFDSDTVKILATISRTCSGQFSDIADMKRGVLFNRHLLTAAKTSEASHRYFEGDIYRYRMNFKADNWIEFDDKMKERPKEFHWFEGERILLRRLVNRQQRLMAMLVTDTFITNKNLYSLVAKPAVSPQVVLALLNSKLFSYLYLKQVTQATKDDFPQVTIRDIKALPIPPLEKLVAENDEMTALVNEMFDLHRQLAGLSGIKRQLVEALIATADKKIDELVYRLYGLSEEEIALIE